MKRFPGLVDVHVTLTEGSASGGRQITAPVFFGSGNPDVTKLVEKRLQDAFAILSGLQQPDHPSSDQEADGCRDFRAAATIDLFECGLDILAALGISPADLATFDRVVRSTKVWLDEQTRRPS